MAKVINQDSGDIKSENKDNDKKSRIDKIEKRLDAIEKRLNPNFGKGITRSDKKTVSLHNLDLNE